MMSLMGLTNSNSSTDRDGRSPFLGYTTLESYGMVSWNHTFLKQAFTIAWRMTRKTTVVYPLTCMA